MWSSLVEHIAKTILFTAFVIHALQSAQRSSTNFSYAINSLIGIFALWMVKGEVDIAVKRLRRKLPPGYLGFPIYREIKFLYMFVSGSLYQMMNGTKRRKYGTMFSHVSFGNIQVVLGGQDDLSWLFNNDRKALTEVAWPPNIARLLGPKAVANQSGKYHRVMRRMLEPYFAPKFVNNNYITSMDQTTLEQLDRWSSSGKFLSSEVFKMYTLRLFYASSFGRVDEDVITALHNDFKIWLGAFVSFTRKLIPGTAIYKGMKARDRILKTFNKLIDTFMKENGEESERAKTTVIGCLVYGKDKDNNQMMTRDEVKDNMLNIIFAGHDTTFASISSLLYHLSQNPDAMEALAEEVSTMSEPLKSDELKNAPVLNACMHESWRVDPPVLGSFRKAVKEIQHKGYLFDVGTVFNYSILMPTTDENLYKNHDKFNMRRFLPKDHQLYREEVGSGIDPLQGRTNYPIFGGGTHVCLGKAFAQLELRVLATRMLKHYKVEVRNPQKVAFPINGWNVEFKLTKRKNA